MRLKGHISLVAICFVFVAKGGCEISKEDELILSSKNIFVAIVDFESIAPDPTKEVKRFQWSYGGITTSFRLEMLRIRNLMYISPAIELTDSRFHSSEVRMKIGSAWNQEIAAGKIMVRSIPIDSKPSIAVFGYCARFPESPLIIDRILDISDEVAIRNVVNKRLESEREMRLSSMKILQQMNILKVEDEPGGGGR